MRGRARVRHKGRQREGQKTKHETRTEKVYSRRAGRPAKSTSFPARSLRLPEEAVERKRRKETEEETERGTAGNGSRRKEKHSSPCALVYRRCQPPRLFTAFVFLVIVAVPSGGRLWLASRREKQTEERRTERQEERQEEDRGGQSDRETGEADISRSAKGGREGTPEN